MQSLRSFKDAFACCKRLFSSGLHAYERGGLRRAKKRPTLSVAQKNELTFDRLKTLTPIFLAVYVSISLLGNWFHESLHCHCEHCSEYVCVDPGVNSGNESVVSGVDSCDEFDCPICRLLSYNRSFVWAAPVFSIGIVALSLLFMCWRKLSSVTLSVYHGRAPPLRMSF